MKKKKLPQEKTDEAYCNKWLHTFPLFKNHCLMAIGIIHVLKVQYDSLDGRPFSFRKVRTQVGNRVAKIWYRELIWSGSMRYNLDMTEAGWMNAMPRKQNALDDEVEGQ